MKTELTRLKKKLDRARRKLDRLWAMHGVTTPQVLKASEAFDRLLNQYQRLRINPDDALEKGSRIRPERVVEKWLDL